LGCVGFVPGQNDPIGLAGLGGAESIVNFAREEFGKMTAERQAQAKQAWQQAAGGVSDHSVIGAGGESDAVPAAAALPSVDELFKELGLTDFIGGLETIGASHHTVHTFSLSLAFALVVVPHVTAAWVDGSARRYGRP
jgi:hypothetical protein